MFKLIEEDADSFARRGRDVLQETPELMKPVEEFYRAYRALAERYDHAYREHSVRAHRTMASDLILYLKKIIKEREQVRRTKVEKSSKDFLDMLLDLSRMMSSKNQIDRLSYKCNRYIRDCCGMGNVELVNNPALMEKAKEEIDSVVGKNRLVKKSDIANLPYLQAIFKETLRLHPPIPIFERESTEDCKVAGL
ncbi:hypothetical protein IFM89_033717 [Coptis chinensis]|uniref:NAB domain-containing protein n=1 Tax=Coptis chinensis TaxID=261450 RepID=A0A835GZI3_9MAGN|nr:hypothetical protein IFM89_033717 [Coptis chinensis]